MLAVQGRSASPWRDKAGGLSLINALFAIVGGLMVVFVTSCGSAQHQQLSVGAATGTAPCAAAALTATTSPTPSAAHQSGVVVVFTNQGPTCSVTGYPVVNELNGSTVVGAAKQTPQGYLGGQAQSGPPQPVVLVKGATAASLLEGPATSQPSGNVCSGFTGLQLGPPSGGISATVAGTFRFCSLEVHPLQPGTTGGLGA